MDRRGGQLAQGCPWSLPFQGPFPGGPQGPRLQDPYQETRLGEKGASQYWWGLGREPGEGGEKGRLLTGKGLIFGTICKVPLELGTEEVGEEQEKEGKGRSRRRNWEFRLLFLEFCYFSSDQATWPMVKFPRGN